MAEPLPASNQALRTEELLELFGQISPKRIRTVPPPGKATERDLIALHGTDDSTFELIAGVLLRKGSGARESHLAGTIRSALRRFARAHALGLVVGAGGLVRVAPGLVLSPDVCFVPFRVISQARVAPRDSFWGLDADDLANRLDEVEKVLSHRERLIVELHHGLRDGHSRSLEEIGRRFKISTEQAVQIEADAVKKLGEPSRFAERKRKWKARATPFLERTPGLVVDVLSPSNSSKEMSRKLTAYFAAGVALVWYVDARSRTVEVFRSPYESGVLGADQVLDGAEVLPGFQLSLSQLFTELEDLPNS